MQTEESGRSQDMKGKHMGLDIMHYMTMIKGNYFLGKIFGARNLFEETKEKGFKPDIVVYNAHIGWVF